MALILKDRVKETTTTTSTGTVTLLGAADGYQSFAAIGNGNTTYYTIAAQTGTEWEVGIGTYTSSGTTLSRDTVLASSNGGSLVNFSAGIKDVFVTQPSEKAVYTDATNLVNVYGNATNLVAFTEINVANLTANTVTLTAGTISTNAANASDITNKAYVDGLFSTGISYHSPVLVESPTALNAVYVQPNGAGNGVGATLTNNGANAALVIDGVSLSNTARVLVYTQANAVQNGIYTVTNPGAPDPGGAQWVLTRATDADTYGLADPNKLGQGDAVFVQSGNTGAGETYVCTTSGTITFGSTNITFAQISTSQIYSAGTGLTLANLTFSISNTAVTAATYGNDGNVAQFTVNAQGQLTNASNVAINASSITTGTLPNAQTTASSANGASTIVLRDTNGSFNANVGTFTTVNATNGNFTNITGNAVALTDINASNITSGTIANARTTGDTANSANTIVLRDANGSFAANIISGAFSGNGSAINAINASNISSGTIDNARTTAASNNGANTIVLRDLSGNFEANTVNAASFIGNGVQITAINASNLTTGTVDNARTTASSANGASTIVLRDTNGSFSANVINANSFSGNGTSITAINASNISSGTIGSAYVSGSYTGITGVGTLTAGTWNANVIANTYTTANSANGASTIVARDANGSFTANTITATTFTGGAVNATSITDSGNLTFTGTSNRIIGDFSNATVANRVMFQTSTTNGGSTIYAIPNGTGTFAGFYASAQSDPTNASFLSIFASSGASESRIASNINGTGTYYPLTMYTGGSERLRVFTSGGVSIGNTTDPGATNLSVTGTSSGREIVATNGLIVNNLTVSSSYSIPSGYSAVSVGPVTVANGVSVTVPSGGRWVVL